MKSKAEVISEILGCKSTEVAVIETPDSITYQTKVVATDEQRLAIERFFKTGVYRSLWAFPTKMRIIAPNVIADENPQMLLFLYKLEKVRGLSVENDGESIIIYCNEIMNGEQSIIDSDSRIIVENNPNYEV